MTDRPILADQAFITHQLRCYYDDPGLTVALCSATGGDIHQSYVIHLNSDSQSPESLFLKINHSDNSEVLACEYQALAFLQKSGMANYYPKPIMFEKSVSELKQTYCMLVMEYFELSSINSGSAVLLGESLAKQHNIHSDRYGWECDNFIGTTPQTNEWNESWSVFFREQRLAPQLALAVSKGLNASTVSLVDLVIENLSIYFDSTDTAVIKPSLLHGDLWSGNLATIQDSREPLFYDPAPYFGDPEVDIAMTKLFGQLPDSFYQAYHRVHPVRRGQSERAKTYDLYHLLNHFNLFGASYEPAVSRLAKELLNEL